MTQSRLTCCIQLSGWKLPGRAVILQNVRPLGVVASCFLVLVKLFLAGIPRNDLPFSVPPIGVTDALVKVVSVRFLHCEVNYIFFVVSTFCGDTQIM